MNNNKKYLVLKACAGLGNRLVTLYAAIKYCEKNNRILIVDWSDGQFDKKGINAFEKCFELSQIAVDKIENIERWNELTHSSNLFKQNKSEGLYDLYIEKQNYFFQKIPSKLFFPYYFKKLRRRWQPIYNGNIYNSLSYGSDLSINMHDQVLYFIDFLPYIEYAELTKYLSLKPFLNKKISDYSNEHLLNKAVGIHIRATDKMPTCNVEKIISSIKLKHTQDAIFLSTDSSKMEELFLKEFPNLILFPKYKPNLKGEGLHQWALYNNAEDLKYKIFEESVMEMFLLSKCQYLYYQGNSTFSNISKIYHANQNNCYDWLKV